MLYRLYWIDVSRDTTREYKADICYYNDYQFIDCFEKKKNCRMKITAIQALHDFIMQTFKKPEKFYDVIHLPSSAFANVSL